MNDSRSALGQVGPLREAPRQEAPAANAEFAHRLQLREAKTAAVVNTVRAACTALGISTTEADEAAGELNWGQVVSQVGDSAASTAIIEELKQAFEHQGFDACLVANQMTAKGVSDLHKKEGKAGAYMDRLTLVVIGLLRGANLDKVRKGMKEANKARLDTLIRHYGLQSKPVTQHPSRC